MATNSQIAFSPLGKTIAVAAGVVSPAGVQAPVYSKFEPQSTGQYRLVNSGTATVFLGVGSSAAEATTNAASPSSGNPTPAIALLAGAVEIMRFGSSVYFSGLSSAPNTVYITPGQGI
jgi:hypothetical protein